ncbi:MAG: class I mannose-6-phosphate isomerase, partial [Pirellulales bacterium]|nr:class I mannose-6-phosphate isomerase [Pirellulales bacterium]
YPLTFKPIFRHYLWGGTRLESVLGKNTGGEATAESWEIVDHGKDQSVVANGELAGRTLGSLVRDHASELLGEGHSDATQFPLLLKYLDCNKDLSVQVHPNDAQGALLDPPDLGKTEAWVVMAAEPGAKVYAGLKRGFDRAAFERELNRGTCELCLHSFEPAAGDCIFIPAGTVHALGAGLLVAEIQQASDTTFRLFDWNRVGADGRPRELHIAEGLDVIDFERGPVDPQIPQPTDQKNVERLVDCDKFVLERWTLSEPQSIGGDGICRIVAVVEGEVTLGGESLPLGSSALLPAAADAMEFSTPTSAVALVMSVV